MSGRGPKCTEACKGNPCECGDQCTCGTGCNCMECKICKCTAGNCKCGKGCTGKESCICESPCSCK